MSGLELIEKNPIFIQSIQLKNYRTYKKLTISFTQNIHTLVGPNECGKTNLLLTFELLNNPHFLKETDICCFADNVVGTKPEIIFKLNSKILGNNLPEIKNNEVLLKFKENTKDINISGINNEVLSYQIYIKSSLPTGQIHIQDQQIQKKLGLTSAHLEQNKEYSLDVKTKEEIAKIKNYFDNLPQKENIVLKVTEISSNISSINEIKKSINDIKIVNWKFDKEQYLPSHISFSDLINNPKKYQSIYNIFKIADIEVKDLTTSTDHIRKTNILRQINEKISKVLNLSWTQYQNLKLELSLGIENTLHISFLENDRVTDPNTRSLGFQWFFAFLLYFNANFGNELKNCVIILDEPGIYLHPGGQKDLLKEIEKLALYNQIIYTTHLPFMINRNHPERIIYLDKVDGITKLKHPRSEKLMDDILLANTLGFSYSNISNFGEVNLFVEGKTDQILIEGLSIVYSQKYNKDLIDLNYVSIISIDGTSKLDSFIKVANVTGIKYQVLLDNDKEGKKKYKAYKENPKKQNSAFSRFHILPNNKEIEDLIPLEILNISLNNLRNSNDFWSKILPKDFSFNNNELINSQIDRLIDDLNKESVLDIEEAPNMVDVRSLKLELMLSVREALNGDNIDEFKDLIDILSEINKKALNFIKSRS